MEQCTQGDAFLFPGKLSEILLIHCKRYFFLQWINTFFLTNRNSDSLQNYRKIVNTIKGNAFLFPGKLSAIFLIHSILNFVGILNYWIDMFMIKYENKSVIFSMNNNLIDIRNDKILSKSTVAPFPSYFKKQCLMFKNIQYTLLR